MRIFLPAIAAIAACTSCAVQSGISARADDKGATVWGSRLWPGGDVYILDENLTKEGLAELQAVGNELELESPVRLHLVTRAREAPGGRVVRVHGREPWSGGESYVGEGLYDAAFSPESTRHEVGHMLGLWHEHERVDRNEHVIVHEPYIPDEAWVPSWEMVPSTTPHIGPYDLDSVMHYCSFAYPEAKCVAMTLQREGDDADTCFPWPPVEGGVPSPYLEWDGGGSYSDGDFGTLAVLYCDYQYCDDRCASDDRCSNPNVLAHKHRVYDWDNSEEGRAWRARYPDEARTCWSPTGEGCPATAPNE